MKNRQELIDFITMEEDDCGYWLEKSSLVNSQYWEAVSEYLSGLSNRELKEEYLRIKRRVK